MRFIGLDNYENINCYFITAIQILHSSETLNNSILRGDFDNIRHKLTTLLEPVCIYAKMEGTDDEISDNIKKAMLLNPPLIRDGYNWIVLLNFYYFPIIYNVLGLDDFCRALEEMSIEKRMIFTDIKPENKEMLPPNEFNELIKYVNTYKNDMDKILNNYNPTHFEWKITALEMYIDDKYGHVAPIFNNNGVLYIFDDHNMDTIYNHFVATPKKLSTKLRLYYFNKNLAKLYNDNLHISNNDTGFVENNFSYVFREFNKYIPMYDGTTNIRYNSCPIFYRNIIIFLSVLSFVLMIIIIYMYIKNNTHKTANYTDISFNTKQRNIGACCI